MEIGAVKESAVPGMKILWRYLPGLDAKTRLRIQITLRAGVEYLATGSFLIVYWLLGHVAWTVPAAFIMIGLGNNALFLGCIASGLSKRFKDPSMTAVQMFASCCRDFFGMWLAPQLWFLFAVNLFVALPFGSLQFSRRTFALTWLLVCLGLGVAFLAMPDSLTIRMNDWSDRLLLWVYLCAALARLMFFNARISALRSKLSHKVAELDAASSKLAELVVHDELTGLYNRREFNRRLAQEWERANRSGSPFYAAIVDADFFKRVNDEHGHPTGDWVLQQLAGILSANIRECDFVARFGGEEFAILLVGQDTAGACAALERLRQQVQAHPWEQRIRMSLTVSIGAASSSGGTDAEAVVKCADLALYTAKSTGRNRVELYAGATALHSSPTQ